MLTPAEARDLRYLVALFRLTFGITRKVVTEGDSIRTGRSLAKKGLVQPSGRQFTNRVKCWMPTTAGIGYVETNFVPRDQFWEEALDRAKATLKFQR